MNANEKMVAGGVISLACSLGMAALTATSVFKGMSNDREVHNRYSLKLAQLDRDADRAYSQCVIPKLEKRFDELEEAIKSDNSKALLTLTAFPEIDCLEPYRKAKQKVGEMRRYKEHYLDEIRSEL